MFRQKVKEEGGGKKGKKKSFHNADSQTMSKQCTSSPQPPLSQLISFPAGCLCLPIRGWRSRRGGRQMTGGGSRQRDLSASPPRPAFGLTGAAKQRGRPQGFIQPGAR